MLATLWAIAPLPSEFTRLLHSLSVVHNSFETTLKSKDPPLQADSLCTELPRNP